MKRQMTKVWYWSLMVVLLLFLLPGCIEIKQALEESSKKVLVSYTNVYLDEDYYLPHGPITLVSDSSDLFVDLNLKAWDEDYGLELFLMTDSNFAIYQSGSNSFEVVDHVTFYTEGPQAWVFINVPPGVYYFVVDNTDLGWEETDWDGENDVAVFDLELYTWN